MRLLIVAVEALALLVADAPGLAALAVLEVAVLLAVAVDQLAGQVLLDVLVELLDLVDLLALQLALLLRHFLRPYAVDVGHLVLASLAPAAAVAEVAVFEALAVAVEAAFAVVAARLRLRVLGLRSVLVEELLQQLLSQFLVLAGASAFLRRSC